MENLPEHIIVNLDSQTAQAIAEKYITFKYVEHWSEWFLLFLVFVVLPVIILVLVIRGFRKNEQERKKSREDLEKFMSSPPKSSYPHV